MGSSQAWKPGPKRKEVKCAFYSSLNAGGVDTSSQILVKLDALAVTVHITVNCS